MYFKFIISFFTISILGFLVGAPLLTAQDSLAVGQVVITGTKYNIPIEKSGKTIYKLNREDLHENAGKTIADILNEVPGVHIGGNFGTRGSNLSYLVRGSGSKNTLVLIDGQPLNDPSGVDAQYDLRLLPLDQVESIEVLKGGLSTLYGTGAAAAVINIKLIESSHDTRVGVNLHGGSFGTFGGSTSIAGRSGSLSYAVYGSHESVSGLSAASDANGGGIEFSKDGFDQRNAMLKLGYEFTDNVDIKTVFAIDDIEAEFDNGAFTDGENTQSVNQFRMGITPRFKYSKGSLKLQTVYNNNERDFVSSFPAMYNSRNLQMDLIHEHAATKDLKILWGINFQSQSYEEVGVNKREDSNFRIIDPYASIFIGSTGGLNLHAGLRLNTHSDYDSKLLYNINPSYLIKMGPSSKLKLLASLSSSYITPSLFQLYSPFFGNNDLSPEVSVNAEVGVALYIDDGITINAAYFQRDETDPINFVSEFDDMGNYIGGAYQNTIAERTVNGVEIDGRAVINNDISLTAYFAYVTSNVATSLYRIPKTKLGANLQYNLTSNVSTSLKYNYTSQRTTFDFFSFSEVELESYGLIDLYAQYKLLDDKLTIYGAINNVFDEGFIGVIGFTTIGRNVDFGMRYSF